MTEYELIIIGGGPAGIGAAISARERGLERVLLIERADKLGGILPQCLHSGFGLRLFGEELCGDEYGRRLVKMLKTSGAEYLTGAAVLSVSPDRVVTVAAGERGIIEFRAEAVIMSTGCRETPCGALPVAGTRPSGVFTAGAAQKLMNLGGYTIGRRAVILGSGDVGVIMAKTLRDAGCEVVCVVEKSGVCGALERNRIRCIENEKIPLLLRHTVTRLYGAARLEGVTVQSLDSGEAAYIDCDTLLVSVGLIPETELASALGAEMSGSHIMTNKAGASDIPWLFVCGNARYVHDLADDVYDEGVETGGNAAEYVKTGSCPGFLTKPEAPPDKRAAGRGVVCTGCPKSCVLRADGGELTGAGCPRGREFAILRGLIDE